MALVFDLLSVVAVYAALAAWIGHDRRRHPAPGRGEGR